MDQRHFTIIGGGIAGLSTAIALERSGLCATVFEAASEMRPVGAGLGLAANAIKAFEALGLKRELLSAGHALNGLAILDPKGRTITTTEGLGGPGTEQCTIHRADLHALLLNALRTTPVHLGKRVVSVTQDGTKATVQFDDSTVHSAEHLIVADGVRSAARSSILPHVKPRYAGYTCWRGVIHAPDLRLHRATETWGPQGRFGIVPLSNERIYWFATVNSDERNERYRAYRIRDLVRHFAGYHEPIAGILARTTDAELLWNDIHDLEPLDRFAFGRILLIGDAAHATTPNMGQGACQAIEDAVVLAAVLRDEPDVTKAFRHFEHARRTRTKWITETSWRLGRVAQWEHPLATRSRNALFRMLPDAINKAQLKRITDVRFEGLAGG